jgi:dTDP-4-dehydrorhamnose reductase
MLGHKLSQVLSAQLEVYVTVRGNEAQCATHPVLDGLRVVGGVCARRPDSVEHTLERVRPDVVVNCIGIVKQRPAAQDPVASIAVNALFPHLLAQTCRQRGVRLIHVSTDCVFSGRKGNYTEQDTPDAEDLYGRTKLLGEVSGDGCLTLRTSMIGRELGTSYGLLEWFLRQEGRTVRGFTRAVFSGFTTLALARVVAWIITEHTELTGLWHVATEPISKFDLLTLVQRVYGLQVEIEPERNVVCDRSLNGTRFRVATGFEPPSWPEMIERMYRDATPYAEFRRSHAYQ